VLVGKGNADDRGDRVRAAAPAAASPHTVLVRPDGYVAKVFTETPDAATLHRTLTALAGRP
jgi:hypothetical protein